MDGTSPPAPLHAWRGEKGNGTSPSGPLSMEWRGGDGKGKR